MRDGREIIRSILGKRLEYTRDTRLLCGKFRSKYLFLSTDLEISQMLTTDYDIHLKPSVRCRPIACLFTRFAANDDSEYSGR